MKLKKALKLFPIKVMPETDTLYEGFELNGKVIYYSPLDKQWFSGGDDSIFGTEKQAVEWLIEGADRKPQQVTKTQVITLDIFFNENGEITYIGMKE